MKNVKKTSLILLSVVISSCGGGGGGGGGSDSNTTPGTDPKVTLTPLVQSDCEFNSEYIWVNDQCTMSGYESVTHLEAIEALPQQDKDDLINWIKSIKKTVHFDTVFPNWRAGEQNEGAESEPSFVDSHLLRKALNDRSVIDDGTNYYMLGSVSIDSGNSQYIGANTTATTINGVTRSKEARVERVNGEGIVTVYGLEVYRFNAVDKIGVAGHFGRQALDIEAERTIDLNTGPQTSSFDAENLLIKNYQQYYKPGDETLAAVADILGLDSSDADSFLTVTSVIPFSYKTDIANNKSGYFSNKNAQIYAPNDELSLFSNDGVKEFNVTGYFTSANLKNIGIDTPNYSLSYDNKLTVTLTKLGAPFDNRYSVTKANVEFTQYVDFTNDTNFALDRIIERDRLISGSDLSVLTEELKLHYPTYLALIDTADRFASIEDRPFFGAIANRPDTKQLFLEKASPHYNLSITPERADINSLNDWDRYLGLFLSGLIGDSHEKTMNNLSTLDDSVQDINAKNFYAKIESNFDGLISDDSEQLGSYYSIYAPTLLSVIAKRAYYNVNTLSSTEIIASIKSAKEEFSVPLRSKIGDLDNMLKNNVGWMVLSSTIRDINRTPALLTDTTKTNLLEHDGLAAQYSINQLIPGLYSRNNDFYLNGELQNRLTALKSFDAFATTDYANALKESDFIRGSQELVKIAYKEQWNANIYTRLNAVLSFNVPLSAFTEYRCVEGSSIERFYCIQLDFSNFKKRFTTEYQKGYLADYPNNMVNPYVEFASKFVEAKSALLQLKQTDRFVVNGIWRDFGEKIGNGIWLSCSASEVNGQLDFVIRRSNELFNKIYDDASFREIVDIRDDIKSNFNSCSNT